MAIATVSDVREIVQTDADDETIQPILDRAARDIARRYENDDFEDDAHRADLEATLAAIRLTGSYQRHVSSQSLGNASVSYAEGQVTRLREQLRSLDPRDEFSMGGVRRQSDRHVQSANNRD
jgi:hypothetical protein